MAKTFFTKHAPVRDILWLFVLTRLGLVLVTYFAYTLLNGPRYAGPPVNTLALLTSWNRWDAIHYLNIARYGYHNAFDTAFFPLYPLLISALSHLLGDWSYLLVGTLMSNAALLGSLFLLYQLSSEALGDQVARRTLLYLCIFPTALFFFAAYNESLFLMLTLAVFLALRRQRWWLAGLLGLLAVLTRLTGLLLILPFLWEVWASRSQPLSTEEGAQLSEQTRLQRLGLSWRLLPRIVPAALIPLGVALYAGFCWLIFNAPLAFVVVQYRWSHRTVWPWEGIWKALVGLFWNEPFGSLFEAHIILDLSATIGFLLLAFLGRRKLRASYLLWLGSLLLLYLVSPSFDQPDPLISNQRFVLEMFPAFMVLASFGVAHPRLHQIIQLIFPLLLATLSILFLMGRWMV